MMNVRPPSGTGGGVVSAVEKWVIDRSNRMASSGRMAFPFIGHLTLQTAEPLVKVVEHVFLSSIFTALGALVIHHSPP